jgi:MazG family protein
MNDHESVDGSTDGPPHELSTLLAIMAKLRDPQTGCPWDVEQDFTSIAPYTIEEAYEVADAIARDDKHDLCDELGDLLLQVVFHARMAEEEGSFAFPDVVAAVVTKMIRRHPHVFGDIDRDDPAAVKARWEDIKAEEKAEKRARMVANGQAADKPASAIDGVPGTLPAVQRAFKLQAKAARVGFDWPDAASIIDKVREETDEVAQEIAKTPQDKNRLEDEIGDLMFVAVNLARKLNIDPNVALERTNAKFIKRFQWVEDSLRQTEAPVGTASLEMMEEAWLQAKLKT